MKPRLRVRHPLWRRGKYKSIPKSWEWEVLWADGGDTPELQLGYAYDHPEYTDLWNQGTAL